MTTSRYGRPEERIHRILDGTALSPGVMRWGVAAILILGMPLAYLAAAAYPQPQSGPPQNTGAAQNPLAFDAASVKSATPLPLAGSPDLKGLATTRKSPGSRPVPEGFRADDPGRIYYRNISLKTLLLEAYGVEHFQIEGPAWLDSEGFEIEATMPPGTTREQFRLMLRNLLSERFKLAAHNTTKELPGYALEVARNGPKVKQAVEIPPAPDVARRPPVRGLTRTALSFHPGGPAFSSN